MAKATAEDIAELDKLEGYKSPPDGICIECVHFEGSCIFYPREVWPKIWLTNQCPKFERTEQATKGEH